MSICKGNSWTAQTLRKKNKQNKFIRKQTWNIDWYWPFFVLKKCYSSPFPLLCWWEKTGTQNFEEWPPLVHLWSCPTQMVLGQEEEKIILLLDVKEFVIHNVNNILNSHRAWWTFSLSRFVHCRHKRGTRKGIEVIAPENILNFILYIKNIKTTY